MTLSLNSLLADIYGTEKCVSRILLDFGLEQSNIDALNGERLADFYGNIKFALECRFLHYSGGYRLLDVLYRRYGLFEHKKETLEEIGEVMGVSRERVRQLQNKAIKRLSGGSSVDATGILLMLCACHALELETMMHLGNIETLNKKSLDSKGSIPNKKAEMNDDASEDKIKQSISLDLPKVSFYISGGFDYGSGRGKYRMLMVSGERKKYIEKLDIEGRSDVNMILLAVVDGLEMLRKPCDITVYSNTLFGVSNICKNGVLRQEVPTKAHNFELKEKIRRILEERGHYLSNIADNEIKAKLTFLQNG